MLLDMLLQLLEPTIIRKLQKPNLNYQRSYRGGLVGRIMGCSHIWRNSFVNNDRDRTQSLLSSFLGSFFWSMDGLHFLIQLPPMPGGRFDGSFQAHFFPGASSSESTGCLHGSTPNRTLTGWHWSYVDLSGRSQRGGRMTGPAGSHASHFSRWMGQANSHQNRKLLKW